MSDTTSSTGRSNDLLWGALGLVGVVVLGYFYVSPQMTELKAARAETQAREQDNQDIQAQIAQVAQLTQELNSQPDALAQLALAAPVGAASDQLLVALQAIASQSGVSLLSVQPTSTDASQSSSIVNISGSYTGIHLFFELLQDNIRPLLSTNVAIASVSDATGVSLLNVNLTITAAQVLPAEVAPTEGVLP